MEAEPRCFLLVSFWGGGVHFSHDERRAWISQLGDSVEFKATLPTESSWLSSKLTIRHGSQRGATGEAAVLWEQSRQQSMASNNTTEIIESGF